ncbi:MAG TPA: hypothetical protein VF945_08685 [Polyangia bacterium]
MSALRLAALLTAVAVAAGASAEEISPQRHALAIAANTEGLRFYRAHQLPRAALRFRDATLLDPNYVLAHYNLACMASRLRDVATVVAELAWLRASPDPLAAAKLDKARSDEDLDFASALPTVRSLLGLAPLDPRAPIAWLAERRGVWSVELPTADCATRTYSFAFAPSGELSLTVREACNGAPPRAHTFDGHATADGDSVRVTVDHWPLWPDGVRLTFAACPGLGDAPGACFTLASDEGSEVGPFHRGVPGTSPMRRLRADRE